MNEEHEFELEVATMIVTELKLEGVEPEDIEPTAPLFGDGLGLDSIDALELALVISQNYGVNFSSDDPKISEIFGSLRNLSAHIAQQRTG